MVKHKNVHDVEAASETIIPNISSNFRHKRIQRPLSGSLLAQARSDEGFDITQDKKTRN